MTRLSFLGAARSVTGSRFQLSTGTSTLLVDCGLTQERRMQERNWEPFATPADRIDEVLLTHAHLDHCGLLPRLVAKGFRGPIYATGPTADIARIVMLDSARLQREDAEQKARRHEREGRRGPHPAVPLYEERDAEAAAGLFRVVRLGEPVGLTGGAEAEFFEAGHILGSASIRVRLGRNGSSRTVLFSGDIGRWDHPILNDPAPADRADYVLMESTYGDRRHGQESQIADQLASIVTHTVERGGNIVIPSFAIERSQEVLYYLNALLRDNRVPHLVVFLDSPMATRVNDVFARWPEYLDRDMRRLLQESRSPFDLPGLVLARTREESKAINHLSGSAIIISGAGMCTGGRVKHHLVHNVSRSESTILFVGYQAEGTLGRQIVEGARTVRILGETMPVRARVERIDGFSGHADRDELLRWARTLRSSPRRAFVIHGEAPVAERFRSTLGEELGWTAEVPAPGQTVELD